MLFTENIITGEKLGPGLGCSFQIRHRCNLYFANAGGSIVGSRLHPSEIVADPLYCDYPSGDLTLSATSPALDCARGCDAMGAFGFLLEAHKWHNIQIRFREFMPVGVRPLLIPVT